MSSEILSYRAARERDRIAALVHWYELARRMSNVVQAGAAAVRECVAKTGLSTSTVRKWAFAAARIGQDEFEILTRWHDAEGAALSHWHVVELARFSRSKRREILGGMTGAIWPVVKLRKMSAARKDSL